MFMYLLVTDSLLSDELTSSSICAATEKSRLTLDVKRVMGGNFIGYDIFDVAIMIHIQRHTRTPRHAYT